MTSKEVALSVHICTRNRPSSVRRLLGDLAVVLDGTTATVTVYDDSTTLASRLSCESHCQGAPLAVRYFGEPQRLDLMALGSLALGPARECLATARSFGTGGWDLAGVRFTAMLNAALDPRPEVPHLFLDDDIRLVDCSYAERALAVDPRAVRAGLRSGWTQSECAGNRLFAAGAPFLGRADLSALEHFEAVLDRIVRDEHVPVVASRFSSYFPVVVSAEPQVHPDSPGISGGFLLTNRHSLRSILLARSYNEDWIWLRQLAMAGGTIRRLDFGVVHAGTPHFRLTTRTLFSQFNGEVLDLALTLCAAEHVGLESHDGLVEEAFRTCAARLDGVVESAQEVVGLCASRSGAATSLGLALGLATQTVQRVQARVRRTRPAVYRTMLTEHLRRSAQWRDAFAKRCGPSTEGNGHGPWDDRDRALVSELRRGAGPAA